MLYYRVSRRKTASPLHLFRAVAIAIALGFAPATVAATDIIISPSHAASYVHILGFASDARGTTVAQVAPMTLVNIDRHHDLAASRKTLALRREWEWAKDDPSRRAFLRSVKESGSMSCWNWIEPLMPLPVDHVHWIAPLGTELASIELPSIRYLESKLKIDRREFGQSPVAASGISGLASAIPEGPWILSLDLDYFDGRDDYKDELRLILELCRERPPILATAAVSMPYLSSEEAASLLVRALVDAVAVYTDWDIIIDLSPERGPVDQEREAVLVLQGRIWRDYDPVADGLLSSAELEAGTRVSRSCRFE